ncbi:hypothetical protein TKK_0018176 [Trichogramma kaykai]|uniref:Elongator complex protein 5 n=1 Tax=Trichogramma kaykai TaxID=54128 RepID=A0ABD2W0Z7_9HYME
MLSTSQILNLTVKDNKFIVVDEDVNAAYADYLIIAWLQQMKKNNDQRSVQILLFSKPSQTLQKVFESSQIKNYCVIDFFKLTEEKDIYQSCVNTVAQNLNSIFVINCLSTLALQIGTAKACQFVEKLSQNQKLTVFCIYKRDIKQNIPRIESLGSVYIKLKKSKKVTVHSKINYEVSVVNKKLGGSIVQWNESIQQSVLDFTFTSTIIPNTCVKAEKYTPPTVSTKSLTTFKIEMSEQEMKQRDSVPLPYTLMNKVGGDIIYIPDDNDDYDEEDPDEDLDF